MSIFGLLGALIHVFILELRHKILTIRHIANFCGSGTGRVGTDDGTLFIQLLPGSNICHSAHTPLVRAITRPPVTPGMRGNVILPCAQKGGELQMFGGQCWLPQ